MAKKPKPLVTISQADLKKLPRNQQRRYLDLGMVESVKAPAAEAPPAPPKGK